ncbi:HVO_A0556 family zinc finger protein [Natronobiforma cellulositropha]|uniref:HVO_A0556 family zinc finger protein n=1 Tax=Natronobiforma cellulositropha TaxID=1679076 RepID=UPI0021D5AC37|nr:HVO_A0556 family zinc finger protein [Natronobiforma cellulositropha]
MSQPDVSHHQLLVTLEGRDCDFCEGGTLERRSYKGNLAAVCGSCHTPAAQIW